MTVPAPWQKSSFSGGGQGDACVEIANSRTGIAVRDSKTPTRATLIFGTDAFAPFVEALKRRKSSSISPGSAAQDQRRDGVALPFVAGSPACEFW